MRAPASSPIFPPIAALLDVAAWPWACQAIALLRAEATAGVPADLSAPLPLEAHCAATLDDGSTAPAAAAAEGVEAPLRLLLDPGAGLPSARDADAATPVPLVLPPPLDVCNFPCIAVAACGLVRHSLSSIALSHGPRAAVAAALGCAPPPPAAGGAALASLADPCVARLAPLPASVGSGAPAALAPLLRLAGPHLSNDPVQLTALLRLVATTTAAAAAAPDAPGAAVAQSAALGVLRTSLLHAVSLSGPSVSVSCELWEVLRPLPWQERYAIYTHWQDAVYDSHPALGHARARSTHLARQAFKRVSKDTLRSAGRQVAKVAATNPLPVLGAIVTTLEVRGGGGGGCSHGGVATERTAVAPPPLQVMDNLIHFVPDALRYLPPLALDVFAFVLVDRLARPRPRTQEDGLTAAPWLSALAELTGACVLYTRLGVQRRPGATACPASPRIIDHLPAGTFFRRYYSVEVGGVLHHVVRTLAGLNQRSAALNSSSGAGGEDDEMGGSGGGGVQPSLESALELCVLRELLSRMGGADGLSGGSLSDDQVAASSGAETLRAQFGLGGGAVVGVSAHAASGASAASAAAGGAPAVSAGEAARLALRASQESFMAGLRAKRAAGRLREAIVKGYGGAAGGVALPLYVLIAQVRGGCGGGGRAEQRSRGTIPRPLSLLPPLSQLHAVAVFGPARGPAAAAAASSPYTAYFEVDLGGGSVRPPPVKVLAGLADAVLVRRRWGGREELVDDGREDRLRHGTLAKQRRRQAPPHPRRLSAPPVHGDAVLRVPARRLARSLRGWPSTAASPRARLRPRTRARLPGAPSEWRGVALRWEEKRGPQRATLPRCKHCPSSSPQLCRPAIGASTYPPTALVAAAEAGSSAAVASSAVATVASTAAAPAPPQWAGAWNAASASWVDAAITPLLPAAAWEAGALPPALYSLFWTHALGDIAVPGAQYDSACAAIKAQVTALPPPQPGAQVAFASLSLVRGVAGGPALSGVLGARVGLGLRPISQVRSPENTGGPQITHIPWELEAAPSTASPRSASPCRPTATWSATGSACWTASRLCALTQRRSGRTSRSRLGASATPRQRCSRASRRASRRPLRAPSRSTASCRACAWGLRTRSLPPASCCCCTTRGRPASAPSTSSAPRSALRSLRS